MPIVALHPRNNWQLQPTCTGVYGGNSHPDPSNDFFLTLCMFLLLVSELYALQMKLLLQRYTMVQSSCGNEKWKLLPN